MYQITDGTFAEARRYCIRQHRRGRGRPLGRLEIMLVQSFYTRVIPSHAVELTAAYLDRSVAALSIATMRNSRRPSASKSLAALIHLCGAGAGDAYVRRGQRLTAGERCGDHDARDYLARVDGARRTFAALAREGR